MKKLLFLVALLCGITMNVKAEPKDLIFSVEIVDNGGTNPSLPKSPIEPPQATLDSHVLTFTTSHADYTLTLLDENGDDAYHVFVPSSTSVVMLPSTLNGSFEILLDFGGSYIFVSDIVL
jgi:hypothetical protein